MISRVMIESDVNIYYSTTELITPNSIYYYIEIIIYNIIYH